MLKKVKVIEILRAKGIEFDENENYGILLRILKSLPGAPLDVSPAIGTIPDTGPAVTIETRPATEEEQKSIDAITEPEKPKQIKLESKRPKRNQFLADKYRDELDADVLRVEISKREHKGKIKTITTIKHMDVDKDGFFVTEFILDMKE